MKKAKAWKWVNVVSAHFYPPATKGPNERVKYIKATKAYYKRWGAGSKPLWDTEMNFGDQRSYMPRRYIDNAQAEEYVARAYIDSLRYGVARVFWYGWNINMLGVDMTVDQGRTRKPGGDAFLAVKDLLAGATWFGCKTKSGVSTCTVRTRDGAKQKIRYTTSGSKTFRVPPGETQVRGIANGSVSPVSKGQRVRITTYPVIFS
jgi:hypothetical protein